MKRTTLAAVAVAAVAAVAILAPSVVHAQAMNPVKFGISGGVSVPTSDAVEDGDFSLESKTGYNVAGHLGFMAPMFPFGMRADIGYNSFDGKELRASEGGFSATAKADVNILSGTLNAIVQPAGMVMAKPYFLGGIGAYRVKTEVAGTFDDGGGVQSGSDEVSKTSVGLNGGAGLNFGLAGFSTFVEARYHYVFNKQSCGVNSADDCLARKATTFVPISFGIMF